jgi:hypothetical protein
VLIAAQHLVDRLRHPRSRADDLAELRRRFQAAPRAPFTMGPLAAPYPGALARARDVGADEVQAAAELLRLRRTLSAALSDVASCGGCAEGHPLPHGRWNGGHCCGCQTVQVFTDDEVAALRLSGTTPARLAPPVSDHAGCVFRGPEGCSLDVADRPNLCVRFVCRELEGELGARGDLPRIKALAAELGATFKRFSRLRAARIAEHERCEEMA